jgi:hypothetical protein
MAVDGDGVFVTQREVPRLALVATAIDRGRLVLSCDGRGAVTLDVDPSAEAFAAGHRVERARARLRRRRRGGRVAPDAIGVRVRAVRFDAAHPRRCNPDYVGDSARTRASPTATRCS